MKVADFLNLTDVAVDVVVTDKAKLLDELAVRAGARVGLQPERILSELVKRERLGSTGMGGGVAIPHARLNEVEKPFALLVRLKKPIDFAAVDSRPVDTVVLLLLPDSSGGAPLSALACISRKLRDPIIMNHLRHARDSVEVYDALTLDRLQRPPSDAS
jgi:nitrogen PTS system EIIA component